jgi:hypothetical protein
MAETSVDGGARSGISTLTPHEHQAALNALARLSNVGGMGHGVASGLGVNLRSATLSGGSVHDASKGADTFVGGAHGAQRPITSIGSDTVAAGSGFSGKIASSPAAFGSGHPAAIGADTINIAGTTAASVKHEPVVAGKAVGQTITLSDKTTITFTGVSSHDLTKPH